MARSLLDMLEQRALPFADPALRLVGKLARRGGLAAPSEPRRRRLVLLQIDGLSGRRLEEALAAGRMPHLARRLATGQLVLRRLRAATAPSTPVFQAGLLYGCCDGLPGFGWYDRALGRAVRMDFHEDVAALEKELSGRAESPLLAGGSSYGTIWPGSASETIFNLIWWGRDAAVWASSKALRRDVYDLCASAATAGALGARVLARGAVEAVAGAWDLARFFRRQHTTRFEWRFLYMRLFANVILRDVAAWGVMLDVLRGVPVIYADFLDYDEFAHRRGPDSEEALANLPGIDAAVERVARAVESTRDYGYELYILSDHGQSVSRPFERVVGEDLASFVLRRAAYDLAPPAPAVDDAIRDLVKLRELRVWWRGQRPWARLAVEPYLGWCERRARAKLGALGRRLDEIEVVTGGSIAHLYLARGEEPLTLDGMRRRFPSLMEALRGCPAIGLAVARTDGGAIAFHRGRRHRLDDPSQVRELAERTRFGREHAALLGAHLRAAVASPRSGDLVLFGAFAPAGNIAFDFELGSHGGIHPDELDQFLVHPREVALELDGALEPAATGAVRAEDFHRFFTRRHGRQSGKRAA